MATDGIHHTRKGSLNQRGIFLIILGAVGMAVLALVVVILLVGNRELERQRQLVESMENQLYAFELASGYAQGPASYQSQYRDGSPSLLCAPFVPDLDAQGSCPSVTRVFVDSAGQPLSLDSAPQRFLGSDVWLAEAEVRYCLDANEDPPCAGSSPKEIAWEGRVDGANGDPLRFRIVATTSEKHGHIVTVELSPHQ